MLLVGVVRTVQKIRSLVDQVVDVLADADPQEMPAALGEIARARTFGKTRLLLAPDPPPAAPVPPPVPPAPAPPKTEADLGKLLPVVEVAGIVGASVWTVRDWIGKGILPAIRINRRKILVQESSLRKFLSERERKGH